MPIRQTEQMHEDAAGLDALPLEIVAGKLFAAQSDALRVVETALASIARGGEVMADAVRDGNQLIYAAAGSSGLMALADACELAGTFGIPTDRTRVLMAGGIPRDTRMPGGTEDDTAEAEIAAEIIGTGDAVIVLSASGRTPYALRIAEVARARGAHVIAIANNPDAALFEGAEVAVCLPTPPELIAGSTRMGAGTAQKVALNMMSTIMGVSLGHVYDGMMVNLRVDNDKLRNRAAAMVSAISGTGDGDARRALSGTGGDVKSAILLAAGAHDAQEARSLLAQTNGHLRAALAAINGRA